MAWGRVLTAAPRAYIHIVVAGESWKFADVGAEPGVAFGSTFHVGRSLASAPRAGGHHASCAINPGQVGTPFFGQCRICVLSHDAPG